MLQVLMLQAAACRLRSTMKSTLRALLRTARTFTHSRVALHLEILALRHQLDVLARTRPRRVPLGRMDRWLWMALARCWTEWRTALVIVKPETVIAWHRRGFRLWWTWKCRRRTGRPATPADVRTLIRTMADANSGWGAPRIHGELLKLGIDVSQATVAKYMGRRRRPPRRRGARSYRITWTRSWRPTSLSCPP